MRIPFYPEEFQHANQGGKMASELREKMIQEMEIRGLDEKTKTAYLGSMEKLTRFFKTTADKIELAEKIGRAHV